MRLLLSVGLAVLALVTTAHACPNAEPWLGDDGREERPAAPKIREPRSTSNNRHNKRPNPTCASSREACQNLDRKVVSAINAQIKQEFVASYVYLAMANYFNYDNVALQGFSKFFKKASDEEREHGIKLMDYLSKRGGTVSFFGIPAPTKLTWTNGKAAVDEALALEKVVNGKLLDLHWTAQQVNDPDLQNMLEGDYLTEQVDAIKQLSDWSTILGRFGTDTLGEHIFDQELMDGKR